MFHKVKSMRPLEDLMLEVSFECGETKVYDVAKALDIWSCFEMLRCVDGLFHQVKVDTGGYGISWNDELDLSCEELYLHSI